MSTNKINVSFSRTYSYTKSVLDRRSPLADARAKAEEDFTNDIAEALNNKTLAELRATHFQVDTVEDLPFKFKFPQAKGRGGLFSVNFRNLINTLTSHEMQKKYGIMDAKINPQFFEKHGEIKDRNGNITTEGVYYLKAEIEKDFLEIQNGYIHLLETMEHVI